MIEGQGAEPDLLAELATLGSLALVAGQAHTSREVASSALDILIRATGADAGVVLYDGGTGFQVEADHGFPTGAIELLVADRSVNAHLERAMNATARPLYGPIDTVPIRPDIARTIKANGLTCVLVAPLRFAGRLGGLIGLGWRIAPAVQPSDAAVLQAATVVAATLENARLIERLQRTIAAERRLAHEESTLQSLTLIGETAGGFDDLATTTVTQIVGLMGAVAGSYALVAPDDRVIHTASLGLDRAFMEMASGVRASDMASVRPLLEGSGPYIRLYAEGAVHHEALAMARERGWTAFAMLPVTVGERVEALIALFFDQEPELPNVQRTLSAVARIASISLTNFRLRERLQASETRYRVLFEESPDGIILLSMTNELIDANPAALRLYRTDLVGLRAFLAAGTPNVPDAERAHRRDIIRREGRGVFRDDGVRPDGTRFPQEVEIVRVDIGGEQRFLVIVRDLSEQDRLQQELLQAQKMEAIGQLVSGVAHELNNPLAAIVAFSQLIRRDDRLPEDMRRDAELLVQEAERTRRIVQSLLDFARQRPPERHPTALVALVDSVLALQSYSLTSGQIELSLDVPPDLPLIDVDRSQLQQVVLNLTLNAIQAIRAHRSSGRIWINARRIGTGPAAHVRLSVSDNGPGIPEEVRSRLFLPFFTTKPPGMGTGLGLSVSFGIVAAHGGTLQFKPRPGGGASFLLEMPVGADASSGQSVGQPAPSARGQRPAADLRGVDATPPRVLVLDDEPAIRAFLAKSLRLAGLDAVVVAEGQEAVALCRAESFAAVLVDHRMPGMTGTQVFDAAVAIRPELASRFVFMSGDVLNPELRDFAAAHSAELLAKPFDVDTVNRLVRDVVTRSQRG